MLRADHLLWPWRRLRTGTYRTSRWREGGSEPATARFVAHQPDARPELETERTNYPVVMSPWEQEILLRSWRGICCRYA
jgi:hypothetical protein